MAKPLRESLSLFLAILLVLLGTPVLQAQQQASGQVPSTATIEGRVFSADRVTPVRGAVVRAVLGDGSQAYSSLPTEANGNFRLEHLPPGNYDIVVELTDGVYVVERTLAVVGSKSYSLSLATVPAEHVEKRVPAVDKPVKGYAWTLEGKGPRAGGFWRTPGGIAIIAGGVVGAALAISSGNDNNNKGSNSTP